MTRYEMMAREQAARFMDELARAVAEERERCAKIADNYQPKSDPGWLAAKWIAAAIRGER